jgi:hypothetical protein
MSSSPADPLTSVSDAEATGAPAVLAGSFCFEQPSASFARLTDSLSRASVRQRWEAHRDVDWDDPAHRLDRADPGWELHSWDPLGASEWYRDQPPERRSAIGLYRVAAFLKVGIEFESVLNEGLLRFASRLPNGHPAFRYVYHEITEEAQHSMMFQELINRSGFDPPGSPEPTQERYRRLAGYADELPVLFFLTALTGEEAFDHIQRRMLASSSTHPLLRRITRIHVTEEARHLSFARGWLRDITPKLHPRELRHLRYQAPFVIQWTAGHMFELPDSLATAWDVPSDIRLSITESDQARDIRRQSMARVVSLCHETGLADPRLHAVWSKLGAA